MSGPDDPYSGSYNPQYTGETDDGDVGSGSDFGADLYSLYAAGRVHVPEVAASYAGLTQSVHNAQPLMKRCAEVTPGALDALLTDREDLQLAFRTTSLRLHRAGKGLVKIANDYVRTDEEAAANFRTWMNHLGTPYDRTQMNEPPLPTPDPPELGDKHPEIPPSPHGAMPDGSN